MIINNIDAVRGALLAGFGLLAMGTPQAAALVQDATESTRSCRQNAMPACRELNQVVSFNLRTGQQRAAVGTPDPIWSINGSPANTVAHPSWSDNGRATWVSSATQGRQSVAGGEHVYTANIWFDQDPYLYDFVRTNLTLGADNTVVSVAVNGTEVYTGDGGNHDFQSFENFVHGDDANWPWVRGCNEVRVTIRNSGGPSGMSVRGAVRARCSRCLTARPPQSD